MQFPLFIEKIQTLYRYTIELHILCFNHDEKIFNTIVIRTGLLSNEGVGSRFDWFNRRYVGLLVGLTNIFISFGKYQQIILLSLSR